MKNFIVLLTASLILVSCANTDTAIKSDDYYSFAASKNQSEKQKLVLELLSLLNAKQQSEEVLNSMIKSMPYDVRDTLKKAFDADEMINLIVPVYEKYLTEDDLRAAISFYKSPAGKKLLKAQPMIMKDSIIVMKVYAQKKLEEVLNAEKEDTGKGM